MSGRHTLQMQSRDKRRRLSWSQGAGLKMKKVQSIRTERSLVYCCTNQQLQQKLREERRKTQDLQDQLQDQKIISEELVQLCIQREDELNLKFDEFAQICEQKIQKLENEKLQVKLSAPIGQLHLKLQDLQDQLKDQKIISEELVQLCIQREDELNLKFDEFAQVKEQKIQDLEIEKQQLQVKLSAQEQTTQELFHKLIEDGLKNMELQEQLEKTSFKQDMKVKKLKKNVQVLQQAQSEQNHEEVELNSRVCHKECVKEKKHEKTNTEFKLLTELLQERGTGEVTHSQIFTVVQNDMFHIFCQDTDAIEGNVTLQELHLKLKEVKYKCEQIESKLKGKEEYIRLLKRDLTDRETLFRDHLRLENEKMEKKSAACRELRAQLQEEQQRSQSLQQLTLSLKEALHSLKEGAQTDHHSRRAPQRASQWTQLLHRFTPNLYTRWVKRRCKEGTSSDELKTSP